MYQQTTVVGRLGDTPQTRVIGEGDKAVTVANFSLAANTNYGSGENRKELTTWYRVSAWGRLAEVVGQYLTKGRQVLVIGNVTAEAYMKDGEPRASLNLRASTIRFLGDANGNNGNGVHVEVEEMETPEEAEMPF